MIHYEDMSAAIIFDKISIQTNTHNFHGNRNIYAKTK